MGWACAVALVLWGALWAGCASWTALDHTDRSPIWVSDGSASRNGLVVLVHGITKGPADLGEVANVVRETPGLEKFAVRTWGYPAGLFSNESPQSLAAGLVRDITASSRPGERIILVGHSIGGLLIRRAYLDALDQRAMWAENVERIVLLAAPNRGTAAVSRSPLLWVGDALVASFGMAGLVRSTYRGSPFIVNLRLDWIRRFRTLRNPPIVAQIVGTLDDVVKPSDSIDVLQFPGSLEYQLPSTTHGSILRAVECGDAVRRALMDPGRAVPEDGASSADRCFKLLVLHGIRDYGERFRDLCDTVKAVASAQGLNPIISVPRYEYFSALQFLNPFSRRLKVFEFADMYAELLARPPVDAKIHFAGHSFGTYLMGRALMDYDSLRLERAYLAGSVLEESFFSRSDALGSRISRVRNDIAAYDWPVGILCSGIHQLGLADYVGTGGFNGFTKLGDGNTYREWRYFDGDHGIALESENQPSIAAWLTSGYGANPAAHLVAEPDHRRLLDARPYLWCLCSRGAALFFLLVLGTIGYLLCVGRRPWYSLAVIVFLLWFLNIV